MLRLRKQRHEQMADLAYGWGRPLHEIRDLTVDEWNMMVAVHNRAKKRRGGL